VKTKQVTLDIPLNMFAFIKEFAMRSGCTMKEFAFSMLVKGLYESAPEETKENVKRRREEAQGISERTTSESPTGEAGIPCNKGGGKPGSLRPDCCGGSRCETCPSKSKQDALANGDGDAA